MDISSQLVSEAGFNLDSEEGDENVQQEQRQTLPKSHRKTAHQLLREHIPQIHDETAEHTRHAFELFLENFKEEETNTEFGDERIHNYVEQIKQLRNEDRTTLYIDFEHLSRYDQRLSELIKENYYRFEPYLRQSVQKLVFKYDQEYTAVGINKFDGLLRDADITTKEFWISFYNASDNTFLRKIRTEMIGQLVNIRGTVTRTSEVRPELLFGTFKCLECGQLVKDVEQQFRLTEPSTCGNPTCNNRNNFALQIEKSKFVDWQKVRVQESSEEVPSGAMPRSMDIILRNEIVERAKAGDKVIVTGIPIVVPDIGQLIGLNAEARRETYGRGRDGFGSDGVRGLKALGARELTYKIAFLGGFIRSEFDKDSITALHEADENDGIDADDIERSFSEEELNNFRNMRSDPEMNRKLPTAIAPHIFGHENIKKGLLLQLLGGVHKKTKEGIHLRGDINVCIVGDPSTAKSQFLKYVSSFMPRAVYTSGKASSAAGLTATVMKDEETGEFTIEAGALMLADNGICCIDEFDKMNLVDQVAIHEAMEQQTISITKAGIQATLNARTSILAAANPIRGRYDKKLSLKQNINMSPPIMSRFDLFFVVLDECDEAADYNIAQHIVNFHKRQGGEAEEDDQEDITSSLRSSTVSQVDLKHYLRYARALKPQLAPGARELLVDKYRQFRQEDSAGLDKTSYRITVRQLESMVRLSEALAKLDCTKTVEVKHVHEACHLLRSSIVTVDQERFDLEEDVAETGIENIIRQGSIGIEDYMAVDKELSLVQVSSNTKIVLEASEYYRIAKAVISKITAHEQSSNEKGIKKSDLVQWYLDEMEDDIESENDLIRERTTIVRVLNRLQKTDGTLLVVQEYDELPQMEDGVVTQNAVDKNPTLTVHPNYADDF